MDRLKTTLITAFVLAILFAPTASAQAVAAKVEVISGNGQMICPSCSFKRFTYFYPMVVKVTDASGNPIAGKTVNWQLVSSIGTLPAFDTVTFTDSNGLSASRLFQGVQGGSAQQPFLQSVINAWVDGASVNFTGTQALSDAFFNVQIVFSRLDAPIGTPLTGAAGSIGTDPIRVHVDGRGLAVPNVSLRILSPEVKTASGTWILDPTQPSASCATGPGADPGSVLTDANGDAVCYPVFGPVAARGPVSALIGGLDPIQFDQSIVPSQPLTDPIAYDQYNGIQLVVTPVTPGRVAIVSGNNQSVDPGKSSDPLVVKVTDLSGAAAIGNTNVAWTVSPPGAAALSQALTTTNSQGQTQTTVTFAPNATGQVTVRAALTGSNNGISTTFNLSTRVLISALTKVSGDLQTAQAGQNFGAPLVVQVVGTNGQPLSNQPISFVITNGTATLSALSALTDAAGRAQITVQAGSTPGTVTVSAIVGNISQTFTLTIIPPGPALSSGSFYNAGGTTRIGALSPCSLVTVIAPGLAPNVQGLVLNTNAFGPWATTLASDTVTVNNVAAPIYSVGTVNGVEQLTFQVPCETAPASSVPITINVGGGVGTVNFPVQAATPGIFETFMTDGIRRAVVVRPDGSFVSLRNPARRDEVVRVFVTGMGPAAPAIVTGALPVPGADSLVLGQVIVGVQNAGARVVTSRVSPNLFGVYELAFQIPADAPTGSDVVLSVAVNAPGDGQTRFSNGSKLPIQ
ncbi:MAG: hypothetical protein NTW28_13140 [Candidatus Solibacter sp.]|nr:hypothetical protein [Candidatus Solibacter sp.]